jgi:uncharacterized alpha-E superfamily protein
MIEACLSRLMVATQQVWENMTCRLTTRMAKLGFDSQKAVVNTYALMLLFTRRSSSSNWTSQQRASISNWTARQQISSSNWTTILRTSNSNWIT